MQDKMYTVPGMSVGSIACLWGTFPKHGVSMGKERVGVSPDQHDHLSKDPRGRLDGS